MTENRARFLHAVNAGLPLANAAMVLLAWGRLPERVPTHFNGSGSPDGWGPKSPALTLLVALPLGLTAMWYLFWLLMPWFRKHPRWINVPNRARFRALPPERQAPVLDLLGETYVGMAAAINAFLLALDACVLRVAAGQLDRLPAWLIFPGVALIVGVSLAYAVATYRLVNRLARS